MTYSFMRAPTYSYNEVMRLLELASVLRCELYSSVVCNTRNTTLVLLSNRCLLYLLIIIKKIDEILMHFGERT